MRSRIAGAGLMLAATLGSTACVMGRIGRASERVGSAEQARTIAAQIELPGREVEETSVFGRCGVGHGKWQDSYYCGSKVAILAVVSGMNDSAFVQIQEQLLRDGWKGLGQGSLRLWEGSLRPIWTHFTRADFEGEVVILTNRQIASQVRGTRYEKRVDELLNSLQSNEYLLGLFLMFQTPTDALRSHD